MVGDFNYHKLQGTLKSKVPPQLCFACLWWFWFWFWFCGFLVLGLLCRHTASNPITAEMHTSGVQ